MRPVDNPALETPVQPAIVHAERRPASRRRGLAVCVRLCDGFYFPSSVASGGDESCALQCPDAPVARYTERAGSDAIDDAVSASGAPYTALPAADRYKTTFDSACTCHRAAISGVSALADPTLRKGDLVMTARGFLVFRGARSRSGGSANFAALSQARSLPSELRASLTAMERAGVEVGADASRAPAERPAAQTVQ